MQTRGQANFRINAAPLRKKAEPAQEFRKTLRMGSGLDSLAIGHVLKERDLIQTLIRT